MNWFDHPETLHRLAAAYALGTLSGPARRRFEAVLQRHPGAAHAVAAWNRRWLPVARQIAPLPAGEALWLRIEAQAFGRVTAPAPEPRPSSALRAWRALGGALQALLTPAPAFALAAGLMLGVLLPYQLAELARAPADGESATELPASYVGVLATADGQAGLIVSSLRQGRVLDIKRLKAVPVPVGQTLYLWTLDAQDQTRPVGAIANQAFGRTALPRPAEALFAQAVALGVTLEVAGTTPQRPSGAFVYRGLCGKLWRVAPAAPASAASP